MTLVGLLSDAQRVLRRVFMKFKQRALALLLSAVMVLTFMPALAFADDDSTDENAAPVATFDANGGYFADYDGATVRTLEPQGDGYVYMYWDWAPVRDGAYKFDGWSTTKDGPAICKADENLEYAVTEDTTFYAKWVPAWLVTFKANGGYFGSDKTAVTKQLKVSKNSGDDYLYSGTVHWEVEDQLRKDGNNVFSHWTDQSGNTVDFDEGVQITANTEFTANWETGCALTLDGGSKTFEDNGESTIVRYYSKGHELNIYGYRVDGELFRSEDGKVVIGWKLNPGDTEFINTDKEFYINEDITLYAVWGDEFDILLNAGEGYFPRSGYGENSKLYSDTVVEGDKLSFYGVKEAVVNGKKTTTYNRIFKEDQLTPPDGKIFEGWYYDEAFTDPVYEDTPISSDFFETHKTTVDERDKLVLYAKYTADYNTVIFDANGGFLYGEEDAEVPSITEVCPEGKALDLLYRIPEKWSDDGEEREDFLGWYLDEACTEKADPTDEGFFVPSEKTTTLYAKWQKPLPDMDLWLSSDSETFFLDSDFSIGAELNVYGSGDLSGLRYVCELEVYESSDAEDHDELAPITVLTDDKYYTWNREDGQITLHANAIKEALDGLSADKKNIHLLVCAKIISESGEIVASDNRTVYVSEPYADYVGDIFDGEEEVLVGRHCSISKDSVGYYYSGASDSEHGDRFNYPVLSVEVNGSEPRYDNEEEAWIFSVVEGENVVKFKHKVYDPATGKVTDEIAEETVRFTGVHDIYRLDWMESDSETIIPGESMTVTARAIHYFMGEYNEEEDYNFDYAWKISEGSEYAEIVKTEAASDNSWSRVTIKAKEGIDPKVFEEDDIEITVEADVVAKGNTVAKDNCDVYISNYYTEVLLDKNGKNIDEYMPVGSTVTVTPVFKKHELIDGKPVVTEVENAEYGWEFDPDILEIKAGTKVVSDYRDAEMRYKGPFTVKRKTADRCRWMLRAFQYIEDEDCWENSDGCDGWIESIYKFKNPEVYGLKSKTYNGKAQKQELEVIVADPYDDYQSKWLIEEGEHYKLVYKNNVKVGKATVEIVGINCYNGSKIVKTFKINPKGTTVKKPTAGKKSFTVKWVKQATQTTGYELQYGLKSNFSGAKKKVINSNKTLKTTIKSLKSKKTYYVRIRTYKTVSGVKYYSAWSKAQKVKTK